MRPSKPASSSGRMPACAYACTIGVIVETGVSMSNSMRAVCEPSAVWKSSSHISEEPELMPIAKLVLGAGAGDGLGAGAGAGAGAEVAAA